MSLEFLKMKTLEKDGCIVHSTSIIGKDVKLGNNVKIGPFCNIDGNIEINDNCNIISHVCIFSGSGKTIIGSNNTFHPFGTIGNLPQDLKFKNEESFLQIGDNNVFRESVTVHIGTEVGGYWTKIGSNNLFMVSSHIAHDVVIGDNNIIANSVGIAGHVKVGSRTVIGGMSGIHQFCTIGDVAMIGGGSMIRGDVPPFAMTVNESIRGVNIIGMTRKGYQKSEINIMIKIYRDLFSSSSNFEKRLNDLKKQYSNTESAKYLFDFIDQSQQGKMGLCKGQ